MFIQSLQPRVVVETARLPDTQLVTYQEQVVARLMQISESRDPATAAHQRRCAFYAEAIGQQLGLRQAPLAVLHYGALLHDIGKLGINEAIIHKPGPLTSDEYHTMQRHPSIGEQIVQPLLLAQWIAPIVRHHHERWDGRGYPDQLAGEDIPLGARIVAIADAFDAMTSQRVYHDAIAPSQAVAHLSAGAGKCWDAQIVRIFVEWIQTKKLQQVCKDSLCNSQAYMSESCKPTPMKQKR